MGGCFSIAQSTVAQQDVSARQSLESAQSGSLQPNTASFNVRELSNGALRAEATDSTEAGLILAPSAGCPSTSCSEYSNVSAVTSTSVLPTVGTKDNLLCSNTYYANVCKLRDGSSGSVHLAVDLRFGNQVAVKLIPRGSSSIHTVAREVLNQRLCFDHPHIIQFREVFLTADHLAIVSEFAVGGDLADYIDRHQVAHHKASMTESSARWLFHQLITGVNFCHQMGIANRDIKLENTLLMDKTERPLVKLCDFGYSKDEYQGSACKTLCGTPEYVAPEVLAHESYDGKAADVWSCGVVLYTLLTGGFPFQDPDQQELSQVALLQRLFPRILAGKFDMPANVSRECQSLLKAMLTVDPQRRIPAAQILQHPWMKKFEAAGELAQLQKAARRPASKGWSVQTDQELLLLSQTAAMSRGRPQHAQEEVLPY